MIIMIILWLGHTQFNCCFFFRNAMIDNMREIEKCKAHVQDVEVPLEVFE